MLRSTGSTIAASVALAAALAVGAAACSEPAPVIYPQSAEELFGEELARAACRGVGSCCEARKLGAFDEGTCERLVKGTLDGAARLKREAKGGALVAANAAACLEKVKRYATSCIDPEHGQGPLDTSPCDALFTGGRAAGEPCHVNEECASGGPTGARVATRALCDAEKHVCELLRPARANEPCAGDCDDDGCLEPKERTKPARAAHEPPARGAAVEAYCDARAGLTCDGEKRVCIPRAQIGEPCGEKRACVASAYCKEGRCEVQGGLGASCRAANDACAPQLLCDPGSKTCVARKKDAESCADDADCASDNCAGRLCRSKSDATMLWLGRELRLFCSPE